MEGHPWHLVKALTFLWMMLMNHLLIFDCHQMMSVKMLLMPLVSYSCTQHVFLLSPLLNCVLNTNSIESIPFFNPRLRYKVQSPWTYRLLHTHVFFLSLQKKREKIKSLQFWQLWMIFVHTTYDVNCIFWYSLPLKQTTLQYLLSLPHK